MPATTCQRPISNAWSPVSSRRSRAGSAPVKTDYYRQGEGNDWCWRVPTSDVIRQEAANDVGDQLRAFSLARAFARYGQSPTDRPGLFVVAIPSRVAHEEPTEAQSGR